jgi:hypothetical protein
VRRADTVAMRYLALLIVLVAVAWLATRETATQQATSAGNAQSVVDNARRDVGAATP